MSIEHSRALLLGSEVAGVDPETLKERQEQALVVVRIDPVLPGAMLTGRVLLATLRRLPGRLALDRSGLHCTAVRELADVVKAIDSLRPLAIVDGPPDAATVCVHIGLAATDEWVRAVPDGYGAQLANDPTVEMALGRPANALGSIFAAALAAAEIFKRTARVLPERCTIQPHLVFCPVTLTADTTLAPELPASLNIDIAAIGNGAIGTAESLILSELALGGRIAVCDPERFGPENRGTYSVGGEHECNERPAKVELVGDMLASSGYDVVKVQGKSTELTRRVETGALAAPSIVLTALDSRAARRQTQELWPDHLIDAATGETAVGLCHAVPAGPCLRCFFPERQDGASALERLAQERQMRSG